MKNKWLIPVVLFVVLVICYIVRGIFQTRITVEMLQTDKIEEYQSDIGVLVKSEVTNTVPVDGAAEVYVQNGQRVSAGQRIISVYGGEVDPDVTAALADVNKKIYAIQDSKSGDAVFINDATKIESEISELVDTIIVNASVQNMGAISENKYRISMLADQKAVAKGEKDGFSKDLIELQAEKSTLEAKLGKVQTVVTAAMPGIFVEGNDGFEKTLTPEGIPELVPNILKDTIHHEKNGEIPEQDSTRYTYKIVDNFRYYIAINLDDSFSSDIQIGDSVKLRFTDFANRDCSAVVEYISDKDEENMRTVVVACTTHVDGLLAKRVVNVDFVKKSISGYKVKVEYLHTVDNAVGLFIKRGAVMRFIPVDIIYSTDEEAIVSASDSEKPIKSYDEVVTSAPEYYDRRVIVSQ